MTRSFKTLSIASAVLALAVTGYGQSSSGKLVAPKSEKTEKSEVKKDKTPVRKKESRREILGNLPEDPFAPMPIVGMPISRSMMENGSGIASAGGFLYVLNGSTIYKINASDLKIIQVRDLRLGNSGASIQANHNREPDELLEPTKKSTKKKPVKKKPDQQ